MSILYIKTLFIIIISTFLGVAKRWTGVDNKRYLKIGLGEIVDWSLIDPLNFSFQLNPAIKALFSWLLIIKHSCH